MTNLNRKSSFFERFVWLQNILFEFNQNEKDYIVQLGKIDIHATREEKDDSDECKVAHERSEGTKTRVRIIVFLLCSIHFFFSCMHRNGHFSYLKRNTRKMSVRIFDKDNFAPIVGYHSD